MKKSFLLYLLLAACLLGACIPEDEPEPFDLQESAFVPVLMERSQLEQSISTVAPRDIVNAAKIYVKGRYIYITERYQGIHIVDNADPTNPRNIAFIKVPGCIDVAAKNNNLYVDNATDLVTLDISNPEQVVEVSRRADVFPDALPPDLNFIPARYERGNRPDNTIIIEWVKP